MWFVRLSVWTSGPWTHVAGIRLLQASTHTHTHSLFLSLSLSYSLSFLSRSGQLRNKMLHLLRPLDPDFDAQHDQRALRLLPISSGTCAPSFDVLPTTSPRQSDQLSVWRCRRNGWRSREWHPMPLARHQRGRPSTTTSSLRASTTPGWVRSRSLVNTFVVTRPPRAHPRPAKTPARAHAARGWPQESSGRPHRQERAAKGSVRPSR